MCVDSRCCDKKSCGNRNETPSDPVIIDRYVLVIQQMYGVGATSPVCLCSPPQKKHNFNSYHFTVTICSSPKFVLPKVPYPKLVG